MQNNLDHYATLGVFRDATQDEIKQAYLEAVRRLHPDKNKNAGDTELFLDVQLAYETLSNTKTRKQYDNTLPPEEEKPLPVQCRIHYSRPSLVRSLEPQLIYILLEIIPRQKKEEVSTPPLNVCLVLDCSTSMQGEKMDVLKNSAIKVMRNLRPQDIFSVVTFSDRADITIPATRIREKEKLESKIRLLQPSGGTEIFQGLDAGLKEIDRYFGREYVNHIILLTDGHTYGDEEKCHSLAKQLASKGIGLSAMGIGKEWNDQFLDNLVKQTGGHSCYIAQIDDIQRFLEEKFDTLAQILADNVILEKRGTPGVEMLYAFRTQPETGPLPVQDAIHLGPVLQDSTLMVLFEYRIAPELTNKDTLSILEGSLRFSLVSSPGPIRPIQIEFSRGIEKEAGVSIPPGSIIQALGQLTLYRIQEKAHSEVEQGQFELAAQHMKRLATNLLSQGERSLARTALIEAENIVTMQAISEEGSKEIKYGTRALITPIKGDSLQ